ncbi:MAG: chorismate synthase, partial [Oceanidesulfovibrio sp.]
FMGVGAVKGVEIGAGFAAARATGSTNNDPIVPAGEDAPSNNAGGILGGISDGRTVVVRAAVKPIPSIATAQRTVDTNGEPATITVGGRHDVAAIPRIVPVLEAMASLVVADFVLLQRRMHSAK